MAFWSFPRVLIRVRMSFLREEMISCFHTLSAITSFTHHQIAELSSVIKRDRNYHQCLWRLPSCVLLVLYDIYDDPASRKNIDFSLIEVMVDVTCSKNASDLGISTCRIYKPEPR